MKPLLSIITVTFNCENVIERTLQSILTDKPPGLEYIVVDGASTDSTLEKIASWKDRIDILISEKDNGIYDAMNKGMRAAHGDFILFINAGDEIYDQYAMERLLELIRNVAADVFYGDTMLVDANGTPIGPRSSHSSRPLPRKLNWESLRRGMVVSHQSFVVKRSVAPEYDLRYISSSDIDWMIRCLKKAGNIVNTNMIISKYLTGGFSKERHSLSLKERYRIFRNHYGFLPNIFNHLIIISRSLWFRIRGKDLN